jgi:hypothetical protein
MVIVDGGRTGVLLESQPCGLQISSSRLKIAVPSSGEAEDVAYLPNAIEGGLPAWIVAWLGYATCTMWRS